MDIILFGGESPKNKNYIETLQNRFKPLFNNTKCHYYKHWENKTTGLDLDYESTHLDASNRSPYLIFAKSAGSVLTIKASSKNLLSPKKCLFVGFPLFMANNYPIKKWLNKTNFPITILQHTSDPAGSYQDVKNFFKKTNRNNLKIIEIVGDTHSYDEYDILLDYVKDLIV